MTPFWITLAVMAAIAAWLGFRVWRGFHAMSARDDIDWDGL